MEFKFKLFYYISFVNHIAYIYICNQYRYKYFVYKCIFYLYVLCFTRLVFKVQIFHVVSLNTSRPQKMRS